MKMFVDNDTFAGIRRSHPTTRLICHSDQFSVVRACYAKQNDIRLFEIVRGQRYFAGVRRSHLTTHLICQSVKLSIAGTCYEQQKEILFLGDRSRATIRLLAFGVVR